MVDGVQNKFRAWKALRDVLTAQPQSPVRLKALLFRCSHELLTVEVDGRAQAESIADDLEERGATQSGIC